MIIAIDFDNTFTADPEAWREVILMMQAKGHKFVCVTGRSDDEMGDQVRKAIDGLIPIVFAGSRWKREAAKRSGWDVDVWIDDMPEMVGQQNLIGLPKNKQN